MSNYGINDIQTLSFVEGVRERIAMYLGSADMQGVYNAIQEIVSNSIDEFYMGYGNKIEITLSDKKDLITIIDYGRGVPFGTKEDGTNVLVDIFSKPHTGGKFNNKVYNSVAGLNGIGAKATCLSSTKFTVYSNRDGIIATAIWEKGHLKNYEEKPNNAKVKYGTSVEFMLDPEVYNLEPIDIDFEVLCQKCKALSYLTKGLNFELKWDKHKNVHYCAENGLLDLVKDNVKTPIHKTPIYKEYEENNIKIEVVLQWTKEKEKSFVFTNGLLNSEGGTSLTGCKTAITNFMKKHFVDLSGDLARTGLVYAVSCKIPNPSFANQTKTKINNPELKGLAQRVTGEVLTEFADKYKDDFKNIIDFLTKENKAEKAAERTRQAILNAEKEQVENQKKKIVNADKLRDARKLGQDSILLVAEGLSAGGSMSIGRDPQKYGILMLRGKLINLLSNTIEDGLENEEVKLLQQALGIIYNKAYNPKKLRYGKVAIATDSDADGSHIGLLIMAALHVLCPKFLEENRLYWLRAPIYKVETKSRNYYYYSEEEFINHPLGNIVKYKGLGQMSDQDLKESMFSSEWQRLEPITYTQDGVEALLELMGSDVKPRKEFVFNNIDFSQFHIG